MHQHQWHAEYFPVAPSPVQGLDASTSITLVVVTWELPDEPNGIIRSYFVSYKAGLDPRVEVNVGLNKSFTISNLSPRTWVDVEVVAVNGAGPGKGATLQNIVTEDPPRENNYYCITSFTCA